MIWLFKVDEVFWGNKPKVNEFYKFEVDDIHFDITQYDVSLYFGTTSYYLLNESNDNEIYLLRFVGSYQNPIRELISEGSEICGIVNDFYKLKK